MKAVVADHMHPTRRPFFSPAAREAFANYQTIPDGVQIWIGQFRGQRARYGNFTGQYLKLHEGRFKGFEFYVFTYVINFMALQLAARRWTKTGPCRTASPSLIQNDAWAEATTVIWPSDGKPVLWPPPKIISDDTVEAFSNRWQRLEQPSR